MNIDTVSEAVAMLRKSRGRGFASLPITQKNNDDLASVVTLGDAGDINFRAFEYTVHGPRLILFLRGTMDDRKIFDLAGVLCMN